jgi:hypothetical protein
MPVVPPMLARLTIRPPRRGSISARASRVQKKVPFRWTASIRVQRSSVMRAVESSGVVTRPVVVSSSSCRAKPALVSGSTSAYPALLTSTSRRPSVARASVANQARTAPASDTSPTSGPFANPAVPSAPCTARAASARRSFTATRAPAAASASAIARPRPEPAPVTSATCPSSVVVVVMVAA